MRKWWRELDHGARGGIVYLAVALTFNFGGIALVVIFDWPKWVSAVFIVTGIVLGVAAGFLTYTLNRRRKPRQPKVKSLLHNPKDRNCVRWHGDPRSPTDLSQRCLNCNPKSLVRVLTRHDEDNWYEDNDDYHRASLRVIEELLETTRRLNDRRRGR